MATLIARDMMISSQYYKVKLLAQHALDDPRLLASINSDGTCTIQPLAQLFVSSVSDQFFDVEPSGNGYLTTFAVKANRNISCGDFMLFVGRCASQLTNVFHGEISDANTPAGYVQNAPAQIANSVGNLVKGTAKSIGDAIGGMPQWLALTAGLVLAAVLVVKFK